MADQRDYGDENDFHRPRTGEELTGMILRRSDARKVGDHWVVLTIWDASPGIVSVPEFEQMTLGELEVSGHIVYGSQPTICPACGGLEFYGEVHVCGGGA